jgi:hypothetical protein
MRLNTKVMITSPAGAEVVAGSGPLLTINQFGIQHLILDLKQIPISGYGVYPVKVYVNDHLQAQMSFSVVPLQTSGSKH